MSDLSEEQIVYLRELFTLFDEDKNGVITFNEVMPIMHMLGHEPTDEELRTMFADYDIDNNGHIDFPEFLMVLAGKMKAEDPKELAEAFDVFDKNGSGTVTFSELRHVLLNIGEKLTEQEVDEMIKGTICSKFTNS
jgi:calmodulin